MRKIPLFASILALLCIFKAVGCLAGVSTSAASSTEIDHRNVADTAVLEYCPFETTASRDHEWRLTWEAMPGGGVAEVACPLHMKGVVRRRCCGEQFFGVADGSGLCDASAAQTWMQPDASNCTWSALLQKYAQHGDLAERFRDIQQALDRFGLLLPQSQLLSLARQLRSGAFLHGSPCHATGCHSCDSLQDLLRGALQLLESSSNLPSLPFGPWLTALFDFVGSFEKCSLPALHTPRWVLRPCSSEACSTSHCKAQLAVLEPLGKGNRFPAVTTLLNAVTEPSHILRSAGSSGAESETTQGCTTITTKFVAEEHLETSLLKHYVAAQLHAESSVLSCSAVRVDSTRLAGSAMCMSAGLPQSKATFTLNLVCMLWSRRVEAWSSTSCSTKSSRVESGGWRMVCECTEAGPVTVVVEIAEPQTSSSSSSSHTDQMDSASLIFGSFMVFGAFLSAVLASVMVWIIVKDYLPLLYRYQLNATIASTIAFASLAGLSLAAEKNNDLFLCQVAKPCIAGLMVVSVLWQVRRLHMTVREHSGRSSPVLHRPPHLDAALAVVTWLVPLLSIAVFSYLDQPATSCWLDSSHVESFAAVLVWWIIAGLWTVIACMQAVMSGVFHRPVVVQAAVLLVLTSMCWTACIIFTNMVFSEGSDEEGRFDAPAAFVLLSIMLAVLSASWCVLMWDLFHNEQLLPSLRRAPIFHLLARRRSSPYKLRLHSPSKATAYDVSDFQFYPAAFGSSHSLFTPTKRSYNVDLYSPGRLGLEEWSISGVAMLKPRRGSDSIELQQPAVHHCDHEPQTNSDGTIPSSPRALSPADGVVLSPNPHGHGISVPSTPRANPFNTPERRQEPRPHSRQKNGSSL